MCRWQVATRSARSLLRSIHLVADVWVDLGRWSISDVVAIWEDSRVDSRDQLVSLLDDVFLETVTVTLQELLHIWCVR